MSIHQDIKAQVTEALKAHDKTRLNVLRGLLTSIMNELVVKKHKPDEELGDEDVLTVITRAVKQRKDSIEQFEKGGRQDLAGAEKDELSILEKYLPTQMSKDEIFAYVKSKTIEPGANKNQFMGMIMKELKGKADGNIVKEAVDSLSI